MEQQWIIVRRTYTASGACYGRAAYRKGFHDCVSLLQEMGLSPSAVSYTHLAPADELEMIVDKKIWPIPTYGELMFEI